MSIITVIAVAVVVIIIIPIFIWSILDKKLKKYDD